MFSKIRFTSKHNGSTAGIVLSQQQQQTMTITEISKLFPYSESMKMERIQRGEYFKTWEEAFNDDLDIYHRS